MDDEEKKEKNFAPEEENTLSNPGHLKHMLVKIIWFKLHEALSLLKKKDIFKNQFVKIWRNLEDISEAAKIVHTKLLIWILPSFSFLKLKIWNFKLFFLCKSITYNMVNKLHLQFGIKLQPGAMQLPLGIVILLFRFLCTPGYSTTLVELHWLSVLGG